MDSNKSKVFFIFDPSISDKKVDKFLSDVDSEVRRAEYYKRKEREHMELVGCMVLAGAIILGLALLCGLIYWLTGYNIANITLERI
jgi:hypothetical protein